MIISVYIYTDIFGYIYIYMDIYLYAYIYIYTYIYIHILYYIILYYIIYTVCMDIMGSMKPSHHQRTIEIDGWLTSGWVDKEVIFSPGGGSSPGIPGLFCDMSCVFPMTQTLLVVFDGFCDPLLVVNMHFLACFETCVVFLSIVVPRIFE